MQGKSRIARQVGMGSAVTGHAPGRLALNRVDHAIQLLVPALACSFQGQVLIDFDVGHAFLWDSHADFPMALMR